MNTPESMNVVLVEEDQTFFDSERIDDLFSICTPNQAGTLGLLAQASATGVKPALFLERFANELSEPDRSQVQHLADECHEGRSLIEVFESGTWFFPPPVILAMRLAHDSGTLDDLCTSIADRPIFEPKLKGPTQYSPVRQIIAVMQKGFFVLSVVTFVMLFVIPQFREMFEEFGFELPKVTRWLIYVSAVFCQFWFVFFGLAIIFAFWFARPFLKHIRRRFNPSRWLQTEHAPSVQVKLNLAWLCDSGMEFAAGLKQLAQFEPNKRMTSKIANATDRVDAGQAPWKALRIAGVLSEDESRSLETARSAETQSWLLRQMAVVQSGRKEAWSATRVRLFTALANVALGLFVLLFCVGMFAPLIHIIRHLTP